MFAAYHCGACRPTCTQSERHGGWSMEKGPPWVCQRYKFNIFCLEPAGAPLQLRDESKNIVLIKALVCTDFKATSEHTPWFFKNIGEEIKSSPYAFSFFFFTLNEITVAVFPFLKRSQHILVSDKSKDSLFHWLSSQIAEKYLIQRLWGL